MEGENLFIPRGFTEEQIRALDEITDLSQGVTVRFERRASPTAVSAQSGPSHLSALPPSELEELHHSTHQDTVMDLDATYGQEHFHAPGDSTILPATYTLSLESDTAGQTVSSTKVAEESKPKGKKKVSRKKGSAGEAKTGKKIEETFRENEEVDELDEDEVKDEPETSSGKKGGKAKGGKKVLIAKKPVWNDLPDWTGRDDCPLMTLPSEVLDLCFCVREELAFRDYLALAGVSTFFRHHLDDAFFQALDGSRRATVTYSFGMQLSREYRSDPLVAARPFTRNIPAWRVPRPADSIPAIQLPANIIPDGPRDTWSKEEYESYRLAKTIFRQQAKESVKNQWDAVAATGKDQFKNMQHISVNGTYRSVRAAVLGRLDGEAGVEKGPSGYPVSAETTADTVQPANGTPVVAGSSNHSAATAAIITGDKRARTPSLEDLAEATKKKRLKDQKKPKGKSKGKQKWKAPETDEESDLDVPPLFDVSGKYEPHDYWPSRHRRDVADFVNEVRIGKTEALSLFKIREAEIITLKQVYIHNPMNSKHPQQLFVRAAVEALALRSHGGVDGHAAHMDSSKKRSAKIAETREKKTAEAKANGTYVYKPKKQFAPHWANNRGGSFFDFFDDPDFWW